MSRTSRLYESIVPRLDPNRSSPKVNRRTPSTNSPPSTICSALVGPAWEAVFLRCGHVPMVREAMGLTHRDNPPSVVGEIKRRGRVGPGETWGLVLAGGFTVGGRASQPPTDRTRPDGAAAADRHSPSVAVGPRVSAG